MNFKAYTFNKIVIFITLMFLGVRTSYGQQAETDLSFIGDLIEHTIENSEEEIDFSDLFDDLYQLYRHPLNLNVATKEQLEKIQVLSDFQIQGILDYRKETGNFLTIYELQNVHGFSREIVELLMPFITVGQVSPSLMDSTGNGRNDLFCKVQRTFKSGVDSSVAKNLPGSPYKMYLRYNYNLPDKIEFGMTAENDPGEEFFRGSNPGGFDFYSAHIQINNYKFVRTFCIGDYQAGFGQGLTFWTGSSFGKSTDILLLSKREPGIQRYISTNENRFLRGIGSTIQFKYMKISAFFSRKFIDANPSSFDSIQANVSEVSSLQTSGLHTTASEIKSKRSLGETVMGSNLSCSGRRFKAGLTFAGYKYNALINPPQKPYNQFDFRGKENHNAGIDYQLNFRNFRFYGESAVSGNMAKATINGAMLQASSNLIFNILYRYYDPAYHAFYSGALSENTKDANEQGFLVGTTFQPYQKWKFSGYFDMISYPWLKYGAYEPGSSYDYLMRLSYDPSESLSFYTQIKSAVKPANNTIADNAETYTENKTTRNARFSVSYKLNEKLALRNRVEFSNYQFTSNKENGYLLYQDIIFKMRKPAMTIAFRYAIFDTDGYNSRIYAFENDLLYVFSVPAYNGNGTRTYLDLNYELTRKIEFWLKFAYTSLTDNTSQTDLKAQFHFKF